MDAYWINLDGWVIQDGNYSDFHVGQETHFALEFHPYSVNPLTAASPALEWVSDARYRFVGSLAYTADSVRILDCGTLKAYQRGAPPGNVRVGDWLGGELVLMVDPFQYFEQYSKLPDIPALIYPWRINRIRRDATPWLLTTDEDGRKVIQRDVDHEAFVEVLETDVWNENLVNHDCSYFLIECSLLGEPSHQGAGLP